jgi:hypothetical protein
MITINKIKNKFPFSRVLVGQTFIDPNSEELSMKIEECSYHNGFHDSQVNTVSLEDGQLCKIWDDEYVELVDLDITIK